MTLSLCTGGFSCAGGTDCPKLDTPVGSRFGKDVLVRLDDGTRLWLVAHIEAILAGAWFYTLTVLGDFWPCVCARALCVCVCVCVMFLCQHFTQNTKYPGHETLHDNTS